MKLLIEYIDRALEEELVIRCHEVNDEVLRLMQKLKNQTEILVGYDGDNIHRIPIKEVYYFDSVDGKTFIYCKEKVFESKLKLYEFEELSRGTAFFRSSKSTILNASKISYVSPSLSGRFEAKLLNGEIAVISRQFVPQLKKILDL